MPEKSYYAHINQDGIKQTLKEHLLGAATRAALCLKDVGLEKSAYLAGLLHDLGKFTDKFQSYLAAEDSSKRGSVIHTFQGCRYFLEQVPDTKDQEAIEKQFTAELLAFAVGAHHGLFDCIDEAGKLGMQYRREKEGTAYSEALTAFFAQGFSKGTIEELFSLASDEIDQVLLQIEQCYSKDDEYCFEVGLLARLLLSAVIEGDRHDTASFMNREVVPSYNKDMRLFWSDRLRFMETKLQDLQQNSSVSKARTAISDQCRAFAEKPPGIYRLNVPTGGGKTLSSLRYALAHARKYNHKRVIFTSPLLSILEQNAEVIRSYVGDDSIILEHHSNVVQTEQTSEELDVRELLIQSWNAPIILTTLVQLLNCMFDGKTSSVRRFQALCNSVIVIDEVQTVPTKLLSLFNLTIRFLAEHCGATVILCSATQPYLEGLDHPLLPVPEEMVPYDPAIWEAFRRTQLEPMGNYRLDELPKRICTLLTDTDSLLVVCNRKDEAAYLLAQTSFPGLIKYHLSASMCMQHRRDTVAALKHALEFKTRKEKILCVSTQVIEAGVDISFQRVLRLTAGMDSVVQAAGRCNRNRESAEPCPVYIINCTDEKLSRLPDIQRGKTATISLLSAFQSESVRFQNDLASDAAIQYYYQSFYSDMPGKARDYPLPTLRTTMFDLLSENNAYASNSGAEIADYILRQAFKTAGREFSVFDENTVDVLVPYQKGAQLISQMCEERCKYDPVYCTSLLKQAVGYTVSLYDYQHRQLAEKGALYPVCNGCAIALLPEYYDEQVGFKAEGMNMAFWEV